MDAARPQLFQISRFGMIQQIQLARASRTGQARAPSVLGVTLQPTLLPVRAVGCPPNSTRNVLISGDACGRTFPQSRPPRPRKNLQPSTRKRKAGQSVCPQLVLLPSSAPFVVLRLNRFERANPHRRPKRLASIVTSRILICTAYDANKTVSSTPV